MTIRACFLCLAAALLAGCASSSGASQDRLKIETVPSGARAGLENGEWCMTPCALEIRGDGALIELSGVGVETETVWVRRNRNGKFTPAVVTVEMKLVHKPSGAIEAAPLATPEGN
ncbi:MAG: hypothetical protein Tsb0010_08860 [Parvularculaceae bacterium]